MLTEKLYGRLYKVHFDDDGYFKGTDEYTKMMELHISPQMNTDGVALFRSSTFSVSPVNYLIDELPPNCRYIYTFIFFQEGTVTNRAISLLLSAVRIFLSLTTITVTAGKSAREIVMFS